MQCTAAAGGAVAERPTAARHAAGMMRGAEMRDRGDEPARAVHRARARRAPVIWLFSIFNARQRLVLLARGYNYVFPCPLSRNGHRCFSNFNPTHRSSDITAHTLLRG